MIGSRNLYWTVIGLVGLTGGIMNGCLGVGAAILLIPMLTLVLGMPQLAAQGTSLWVMVPMALMSAVRYSMRPNTGMDYSIIIVMSMAAIVGANIGSSVAFMIPVQLIRKLFAVFIIIVGFQMLVSK